MRHGAVGDRDAAESWRAVEADAPAHAYGGAPARAPRHGRTLVAWLMLVMCVSIPGEVLADIYLTFASVSGSRPVGGGGTNNASVGFGTISAFGPLATGVTRAVAATDYTISTDVGVRVEKGLLSALSPSYTLRARLPTANVLVWRVNGITMTTSYALIATSQPYGSTVARSVAVVVPFSRAAGPLSTQLEFLAIAN